MIALPKKQPSSVRPIAIGDIIRRTAGKCLLLRYQKAAAKQLWPHQLGVGAPGDCDVIAMRCREWRSRGGPKRSLVKVDWKNAFNAVRRNRVLDAACRLCPSLYHYAVACYAADCFLQGPGYSIDSEEGVHQGCPASPLFFDLAIHENLVLAANVAGVELNLWHQDDAKLAGSWEGLEEALRVMVANGAAMGLTMSVPKCEVYGEE